ncbi:ABC transporter ATP-binding protein [Sporolactobacillus nakayamae]|uniref:Oligopeptide transport system ATP-binding protein n=1 Tax=Sporolactobacillus nakayamae TaxID=269670 RepID=A0A1I2UQ32_9BACL|nr:ATP-binding cassette domain-containing protein [Sporolactobacillus nakayamae]SFG79232.1 oligopeptide transport system ATP-binding protein [Sporolactobacillus nakayamae]
MAKENAKPILTVRSLKKYYVTGHKQINKAVDGVSFCIYPGETFGLVGESGSGKSTTGRSIIRLETPTQGDINFLGKDLSGNLSKQTQRWLRSKIQMIFQDPMASLNPRRTVLKSIEIGLKIHHIGCSDKERKNIVFQMLRKVGLSEDYAYCYPQDLSGGQRQRVGIARALIMEPPLVIADEPISALDVSIQAQIVNLMKDIQEETGTAYLFIAHDLSMVRYLSDRIGVMHLGHLVEIGTSDEIFHHAQHPYTQSLLSAIPTVNPEYEKSRTIQSYQNTNAREEYGKANWSKLSGTHYVLQP